MGGKCRRDTRGQGLENCGEEGLSIYRPVFQFAWRNSLCPELRLLRPGWNLGGIGSIEKFRPPFFLLWTPAVYIYIYTSFYVLISERSNPRRDSSFHFVRVGLRFVSIRDCKFCDLKCYDYSRLCQDGCFCTRICIRRNSGPNGEWRSKTSRSTRVEI